MVAIRVYNGLFGPNLALAALRMGDLIAVCNFLEYIRELTDQPKLQMCLPDEVVFSQTSNQLLVQGEVDHCIKFRDWLTENTDYICKSSDQLIELNVTPGTDPTYSYMYNIWNIRKDVAIPRQDVFHIEDRVILPGNTIKEDCIVIHPLVDAPYNAHRNWPLELIQRLIDDYQYYTTFDKVLIAKEPIPGLNEKNFRYSHDFNENLEIVRKCVSYIGGDTGFSHFAGALSPGPKYCQYLYSQHTYGTTFPFNWKIRGRIVYFDAPKYNLGDGRQQLNEILLPIYS